MFQLKLQKKQQNSTQGNTVFSERSIFLTQLTEYNVRLQQQQVSSSLFSQKIITILDSAEIFTLSSVFSPLTFPSQVVKKQLLR